MEELRVEIDSLVAWAIEGACGRTGEPACGTHAAREEHKRRLLICPPFSLEYAVPHVFRLGKHRGDELLHLVIGRSTGPLLAIVRDLAVAGQQPATAPGQNLQRIDAAGLEGEAQNHQDDYCGKPAPTGPSPNRDAELSGPAEPSRTAKTPATSAAHILHIVTLPTSSPTHGLPSSHGMAFQRQVPQGPRQVTGILSCGNGR